MVNNLKIELFADGANLQEIVNLNNDPTISGLTTNPTLMRKSGVSNYETFAKQVLSHVRVKPVSFEVFADTVPEIIRQGRILASWGKNVFVKIPVTLTSGEFTGEALQVLSSEGIQINVTAIMTTQQISASLNCLDVNTASNLSMFAGRIADTGVDPIPYIRESIVLIRARNPLCKLIWASPREVLNIYQANEVGCDIITVSSDLLAKRILFNKNLETYSRETVQMFHDDAKKSG